MSDTQRPISAKNKKRSSLGLVSSEKVFTAFKSPCRPNHSSKISTCGDSSLGSCNSRQDTPRPVLRKRKTVLGSSFVSPLTCKFAKTELKGTVNDIENLNKEIKEQVSYCMLKC